MKYICILDKGIMSFTGYKSLEVFNKYYKSYKEDEKACMENAKLLDLFNFILKKYQYA